MPEADTPFTPSPVGTEVQGTVKWWKDEKGYGRILGDDDYLYFAHFTGIVGDGYRALAEGQRVGFRVSQSVGDHNRAAAHNIVAL